MRPRRWSHVSRHILVGVPLELTLVTAALYFWAGVGVLAGLAIAVSLIVAFRCLLALFTFIVSWFFSSRNAKPEPLYLHQLLGILARETGAFLRLFFYYHPFEPLLNDHDPDPAAVTRGQPPVLFVHGFYVNAGFWLHYKRYFRRQGYASVYSMNLDPPFCDIDSFAEQLAARIAEVETHSGWGKVILVAQSMGGLVCRAYIDRHGDGKVDRLITLGTPHRGTVMARMLGGPNLRQMRPDSHWLEALNGRQALLRLSNHVSVHDNVIVPQDNARFPGSEEVEYRELGHVSMAFSREMIGRVFRDAVSQGQKLDKSGRWAQG